MPERYLNHPLSAAAYLNAADPLDRDHFSYGAGRRVCPGVHLAEKSLFLNIARVLWGFDLGKKKRKSKVEESGKMGEKEKERGEQTGNGEVEGEVIEPEAGMVPGWMTIPLPFVCEIVCRSEEKQRLIEKVWKEARKGLKADGDIPDGMGYGRR